MRDLVFLFFLAVIRSDDSVDDFAVFKRTHNGNYYRRNKECQTYVSKHNRGSRFFFAFVAVVFANTDNIANERDKHKQAATEEN